MSDKKIGYYVLWRSLDGLRGFWTGPYDTIAEAGSSTAMRDRDRQAFVLHYAGPVIP